MSTLQGHIMAQLINAKIKIHLRTHPIWKKKKTPHKLITVTG